MIDTSMRGHHKKGKSHLLIKQGFLAPAELRAVHALGAKVFDDEPASDDRASDWQVFAAFEPSGRCVASLETRILPMLLDGRTADLTGLRRVGVDPDWRGLGLMRDLMAPALAWCDAQTSHPILLYTETPELYTRFGFGALAQHAFIGPAPTPIGDPIAHLIDARTPDAAALIHRMLSVRAPLSLQCGLAGAADLVFDKIQSLDDLVTIYAAGLDALVVYEMDDEVLTLVDVVAAQIPSMAALLGVLPPAPHGRIKTLFAPDRLSWTGEPERDDTGLMARGPLPVAMTRPFMLPPTAEF